MRSLNQLRTLTSHLLGAALLEQYPGALIIDCHTDEFGFYCDVQAKQPIDEVGIAMLEEKMRALCKQGVKIKQIEMMKQNGASFLQHHGQTYLARKVEHSKDNIVTLIQISDYTNLCPLLDEEELVPLSTFKILSVKTLTIFNPLEGELQVRRIFGVVHEGLSELKMLVKSLNAAKKRSHLKIGEEQGLFDRSPQSGNQWFWVGKGAALLRELADRLEKSHQEAGFLPIKSPLTVPDSLVRKLGLYDLVMSEEEVPFLSVEGNELVIAPTLTPSHALFYSLKPREEKELPLRLFECQMVSNSVKFHGMEGVAGASFVMADQATIFLTPEQVEDEIISSLHFIQKFIKIFNFETHWFLKGPNLSEDSGLKAGGKTTYGRSSASMAKWKRCLEIMRAALEKAGYPYTADEGDYNLHGPSIEMRLTDAFGRQWGGPEVSLDFNCPKQLKLQYQSAHLDRQKKESDGDKENSVVMLTRTIYGSLERFAAILLEHR